MSLKELSNAFVSTSASLRQNSKQANPAENATKNKDQSFSLLLSQLLESNDKFKYSTPTSSVASNSAATSGAQVANAVSAASSSSGVNISA
jgi:hypothetical protein